MHLSPYLGYQEFDYTDKDGNQFTQPAQPPNYGMIICIGIIGLLFIVVTVVGGVVCRYIGPKIVG